VELSKLVLIGIAGSHGDLDPTRTLFLQGFDHLHDAVGGYVGYAWPGRTNPMYGSVAIGR